MTNNALLGYNGNVFTLLRHGGGAVRSASDAGAARRVTSRVKGQPLAAVGADLRRGPVAARV